MDNILTNFLIALLGWICAAFTNYLADVLPVHLHLQAPFCLGCRARQTAMNYFLWPRLCPVCGKRRTIRVWLVEAAGILSALWLWYYPPFRLGFLLGLVWLVYFGLVALIDLEHKFILLPLTLIGTILGLGTGVWMKFQRTSNLPQAVLITLLGGAAGYLIMLLLFYLGGIFARWIATRKGEPLEEEALGRGDVHLSLVLGLLLGWPAVLAGLVSGIIIGGLASLVYMVIKLVTRKYRLFAAIPYGPYLIAGAVYLLYFVS